MYLPSRGVIRGSSQPNFSAVFENLTKIGTKAYIKGAALRWSVVGKQYVNLLYDVALKPSEIERAKIHFLEQGG